MAAFALCNSEIAALGKSRLWAVTSQACDAATANYFKLGTVNKGSKLTFVARITNGWCELFPYSLGPDSSNFQMLLFAHSCLLRRDAAKGATRPSCQWLPKGLPKPSPKLNVEQFQHAKVVGWRNAAGCKSGSFDELPCTPLGRSKAPRTPSLQFNRTMAARRPMSQSADTDQVMLD